MQKDFLKNHLRQTIETEQMMRGRNRGERHGPSICSFIARLQENVNFLNLIEPTILF